MNFALIGDDPAALDLVRAVRASGTDQLVGVAIVSTTRQEIARLAPDARITNRWDEFLTNPDIDAVIVAGHSPEALDAARQFASAGKPLLLVPRAAQGSAFLYELSLVRDDTGVLLFPALAARKTPAMRDLADAIRSGRLGKLLYLEFERERRVEAPAGTVLLLQPSEIDEALLHDVDQLRFLGGDYNQVTALQTGAGTAGIASAAVTLAGTDLPQATWTMKGSSSQSCWRLKIVGDKDTAAIGGDMSANDAAAIVSQFRAAKESNIPPRDWTELIRAMEIVEATHRSLRRRRTIDLNFESTSERSLFKTQMTAIGCGVLSFTLLAVIALLVATSAFDVRDRQQVESESAGAVIALDEFAAGTAELLPAGQARLEKLAPRMPAGRFSVLVEQSGSDSDLDDRRRSAVVAALRDLGVHNAEQRTATAQIQGRWFAGLLRIAWIAVFAPLFVFLLLQLLMVLARPSAK